MIYLDGNQLHNERTEDCDIVIVGSGPAGASVAQVLADSGLSVIVVEEGPWIKPHEFESESFRAMSKYYRGGGFDMMMGRAPTSITQGVMLGGSSPINGALSWYFPEKIYRSWVKNDPEIAKSFDWQTISTTAEKIDRLLNILPSEEKVRTRKEELFAKGADALGIPYVASRKNVKGCVGTGFCLDGCPKGNKMSMERTFLPYAADKGTKIITNVRVTRINKDKGRVTGVTGISTSTGKTLTIRAKKSVVLAASAIQTPAILRRSAIMHGPVGDNLAYHMNVSVMGKFPEPVEIWRGAPGSYSIHGVEDGKLKIETLGFSMTFNAMRLKEYGDDLSRELQDLRYWNSYGVCVQVSGKGKVRPGNNREKVSYKLTRDDMKLIRRGTGILGELLLAGGATYVTPAVHGWHTRVHDLETMRKITTEGSLDPRAYNMAANHLFSTCVMGSDKKHSVVDTEFRHHEYRNLFIADSSVFPTNTGVNPQQSIMTIAMICGEKVRKYYE